MLPAYTFPCLLMHMLLFALHAILLPRRKSLALAWHLHVRRILLVSERQVYYSGYTDVFDIGAAAAKDTLYCSRPAMRGLCTACHPCRYLQPTPCLNFCYERWPGGVLAQHKHACDGSEQQASKLISKCVMSLASSY